MKVTPRPTIGAYLYFTMTIFKLFYGHWEEGMEVNKLEDVINYAKETAKIFGRCYVAMMDYSSEDYFHPRYIRKAVEIANEDGSIDDCAWCNSAGLTIEQEIHRYREGLKKAIDPKLLILPR